MPALRLVTSDERAWSSSRGTEAEVFADHLGSLGLAPRTVSAYLSDCKKVGMFSDGAPRTYDEHAALAAGIARGGAAPRTRARRLSACARFFDYLADRRAPEVMGAPRNPYRSVRRPRLGVVLPNVVPTPEESRRVIGALALTGAQGLMYAAATALMAGAGLRVSEVASLTLADVDLDRGSVRIVDGKGLVTRDVPLNESVVAAIRASLEGRPDRDWLTPDTRLVPRSVRSIQRAVRTGATVAGVAEGRLHPHAFRHGFGTAVYDATRDLRLTGDLLGHASVVTTQIYTHLADSRRSEAVATVL